MSQSKINILIRNTKRKITLLNEKSNKSKKNGNPSSLASTSNDNKTKGKGRGTSTSSSSTNTRYIIPNKYYAKNLLPLTNTLKQ